jgi:hypothetical protein
LLQLARQSFADIDADQKAKIRFSAETAPPESDPGGGW